MSDTERSHWAFCPTMQGSSGTHVLCMSRIAREVHEVDVVWSHYIDIIMTTASQITNLTVVYSTVYSNADQRKHQSSALLAFEWGIHRDRCIPRTKGQLRGKCFHLMTLSCSHSSLPFSLSFRRLCHVPCQMAIELSVWSETWPIGWYHPFVIGWLYCLRRNGLRTHIASGNF